MTKVRRADCPTVRVLMQYSNMHNKKRGKIFSSSQENLQKWLATSMQFLTLPMIYKIVGESGSIRGRVKLNTAKLGIDSFPAWHSTIKTKRWQLDSTAAKAPSLFPEQNKLMNKEVNPIGKFFSQNDAWLIFLILCHISPEFPSCLPSILFLQRL